MSSLAITQDHVVNIRGIAAAYIFKFYLEDDLPPV